MKIQRVSTRWEAFPLTRPYTIAFRRIDTVENGILELVTDRGLSGRGAASPEAFVTGETREACRAALDENALGWLCQRDPRELVLLDAELGRRMAATPAARAAVDMALHDLVAQQYGVPLVDWLGRAHRRLPTSITIGIKSVEETLAEAEEYRGRGFRVLKVKVGRALEEDVQRLRRLHERFGEEMVVRADANQGYRREEVERFFAATADLGLEFLEQPLPAADVAGLRALPEPLRRRIAADESLLTEQDALRLATPAPACGIFNIKLMKCGGISAARRIATVAHVAGVELMWGCMDESVVSLAAALHAAFSCPATRYLDLDGSLDLARDVATGGFHLEGGFLETTGAPGLGVHPLPG